MRLFLFMFVDRVKVKFIAGKGGNGIVAWKREKYVPKGGPSGGNGGRGGSIFLVAEAQVPSLEGYRYKRIQKAESGGSGGSSSRQGKNGKDLILKVPCGTLVKEAKSGKVLFDIVQDKEQVLLCRGGRGGKGNEFYKSSTHQAPNKCTSGTLGEEKEVELELKLIADVGLVGFPNAGKSTFMKKVTQVPVKVAPYPFTTLRPNLGFIHLENESRILLADIPGIIEGAHANRGLGFEFLRHIERTKILIFIIDASGIDGRDPVQDYKVLKSELKKYDPSLLKRPSLVLLNKIDMEESLQNIKRFKKAFRFTKDTLFEVSAMTGLGLEVVLQQIGHLYRTISVP